MTLAVVCLIVIGPVAGDDARVSHPPAAHRASDRADRRADRAAHHDPCTGASHGSTHAARGAARELGLLLLLVERLVGRFPPLAARGRLTRRRMRRIVEVQLPILVGHLCPPSRVCPRRRKMGTGGGRQLDIRRVLLSR
jgi:hypothetical protein